MKRIAGFLASITLASLAQAATLKADHPDTYHVKAGDTLWGISNVFLEDPWLWPEIWFANPQVSNPHLIYPGDLLKLVYIEGKPALELDRPVKMVPDDNGGAKVVEPPQPDLTNTKDGKGIDQKLTPIIRSESLDAVIPAVPLERVQSFLVNHRVVEASELDAAPYVVAGPDARIVMGAGDRVYGRGEFGEGKAFGIYRKGKIFVDPDTNEYLGTEAVEQGHARMIIKDQGADKVATLELTQVSAEIRLRDRFLATEDRRVNANFHPKPPVGKVDAKIIHIFETMNAAQYDVVVINRGDQDNMEVGTILALFKKGELVRDNTTQEMINLPPERVGLGMVFRTFDRLSYVLILETTRPVSESDIATNP